MKKILILLLVIIASLTSSEAHELIDAYFKAIESKECISYDVSIKTWYDTNVASTSKYKCVFKKEPNDTVVGWKFNKQYDSNFDIYTGDEFYSFRTKSVYDCNYPSYLWKDTNNIVIKRAHKIDSTDFYKTQLRIKSQIFICDPYYNILIDGFSIFNIMTEIKEKLAQNQNIEVADTIINQVKAKRIIINIKKDLAYSFSNKIYASETILYDIAFDMSNNMPIYINKNATTTFTESPDKPKVAFDGISFSNYDFTVKSDKEYFSKNAIPSKLTIEIDSSVLYKRTIINNFGGSAIDMAYNRNQFSYNLGLCHVGSEYAGGIRKGIENSKYNFQFNFIGVDYIDKDAHNENLSNHSYFTEYSLLWIPISILPILEICEFDPRSPWLNIMFAPFIIGNSQFGYIIDQRNLFSPINFLTSSIYVKSKWDFFGQRSTKFWRYKPGFGLEFSYIFKGKTTIESNGHERNEGSNGIFLNCGLDYPIDFVNGGKTATKGLVPSFGLKFAFGS